MRIWSGFQPLVLCSPVRFRKLRTQPRPGRLGLRIRTGRGRHPGVCTECKAPGVAPPPPKGTLSKESAASQEAGLFVTRVERRGLKVWRWGAQTFKFQPMRRQKVRYEARRLKYFVSSLKFRSLHLLLSLKSEKQTGKIDLKGSDPQSFTCPFRIHLISALDSLTYLLRLSYLSRSFSLPKSCKDSSSFSTSKLLQISPRSILQLSGAVSRLTAFNSFAH
jgi:hypothetical protein